MKNFENLRLRILILLMLVLLLTAIITIFGKSSYKDRTNVLRKEAVIINRDNSSTRTVKESFSCSEDTDCSCGIDIDTKQCAYGNKKFIDKTKQCPDFCTGYVGNLRIRCVANKCTQVRIK